MPGDFRCDLTNACAFYNTHCTRGYRAHRAPGIPCALCLERAGIHWQTSGASRRDNAKVCLGGKMPTQNTLVMPGLDPGIHPLRKELISKAMDCRVIGERKRR